MITIRPRVIYLRRRTEGYSVTFSKLVLSPVKLKTEVGNNLVTLSEFRFGLCMYRTHFDRQGGNSFKRKIKGFTLHRWTMIHTVLDKRYLVPEISILFSKVRTLFSSVEQLVV